MKVGVIDSAPTPSTVEDNVATEGGQAEGHKASSKQKPTVVRDKYPLAELEKRARTGFEKAVLGGDIPVVTSLLMAGKTDVNKQGYHGLTALHLAGRIGSAEIVRLLLEAKAEVRGNHFGDDVWSIAARYGYSDIMNIFLSTAGGRNLLSPLCTAAECCHVELTKRLFGVAWVAAAAVVASNVGESKQLGETSEELLKTKAAEILLSAVYGGNIEIISFFIDNGAKPNPTHLKAACRYGHVAAVELLLARGTQGSNRGISSEAVVTALEACIDQGFDDLVSVFLKNAKHTQEEISVRTFIRLMASRRPQLYMSLVLESLTMLVAEESGDDYERSKSKMIPPLSLWVSCKADLEKRFMYHYELGTLGNSSLLSDFLPSHGSLRIQLENGLDAADRVITSLRNSLVTYLLGVVFQLCWFCVSLILFGLTYAYEKMLKSFARTTEACVNKMTKKDALEANFLQSLIKAADTTSTPEPLFADNTIEALIEFHWCLYGKSMHTWALLFFAAQLFLFTLLIAIFRDLCATGGGSQAFGWVLQGILCAMLLYSIWQERYSHLRNPWTAMSLVASLLVMLGQLVNITHGVPNLGVDVVNAFAVVLMWFSLLYYLLPYRSTGPLVRMILMIISDIKAFLMILFIVIIGFAAAFYSIVGYSNAHAGSYSTPGVALRSSFSTLFGGYDLQEMDDNPAPVVLTLLWVAFMVIVSIVLLNILIAIISDSFERLIEGSKAVWLLGKAKTTMKMHALLSHKSKKELEEYMKDKDVLYVLMPKADGGGTNNADWNGRVSAIVNRVKENSSDLSTEVCDMRTEVKALIVAFKHQSSEMNDVRSVVESFVQAFKPQDSDRSDMRSEVSDMRTPVYNMSSEETDSVEISKHQTSETSDIRSEIKDVKSDVRDIRNVVDSLVETCKHQNIEVCKISREVSIMTTEVSDVHNEIASIKDDVACMKMTLQQILEALSRQSTVQS